MFAPHSRRLLAWLAVSAGAHAWAVTALPSQWREARRPGAVMRVQVASVWDAMPHGLLQADPAPARYASATPPAPPTVLPPVPDAQRLSAGLEHAPPSSVPEPVAAGDLVSRAETYRVLAAPPRRMTASRVASLQPPGAVPQHLRALAVASNWLPAPYHPASRSRSRQQPVLETGRARAAAPIPLEKPNLRSLRRTMATGEVALRTPHGVPAASGRARHDAGWEMDTDADARAPAPAISDAGRVPAADSVALVSLLHQAIERSKRYPMLARRQQREGAATVGFSLHPDGRVDEVNVLQSSGFAGLDEAATLAVAGVAPFQPARRYLSDAERFRIRIVFSLR